MRKRLTYANVVSTLALFAVIAGGTAAALPGKKTVQANDLRKNSVRAAAIAKNAVRAAEIKANAVRSGEIKDGSVTGVDVADQGLGYDDLGSNSVVARIRSTGPVETGDATEASPILIPLTGNQWTQAANEIDVLFGEITYTETPLCSNNDDLAIELVVDGEPVDRDFYDDLPNVTVTEPFARSRPFAFEPGTTTPRTIELRAWDTCDNAGEQFRIDEIAANVVAIR